MKKVLIFLTILLCICFKVTNVNAESFYEAEKIDNIFTKSVDGASSHYQKARFFRRVSDNMEAYCLEPFIFFDESTNYDSYQTANNLSSDTWKKIELVAHFGYGYNGHTDSKWYAITQLMIWKIAEPTKDFYFTSYLDGPKIDVYQDEINEINNLVNRFESIPAFYYNSKAVVGSDVVLTDSSGVISDYYVPSEYKDVEISGNKLIFKNIKEGKTSIFLKKKLSNETSPAIFYYNGVSQNLMTKGSIGEYSLQIGVTGTTNKIVITKIDEDTNSTTSSGEASLSGAKYGLYNSKDELIKELVIGNDMTSEISNLGYGKYYIKELSPGKGYTINDLKTYFDVNEKTETINLVVKNKVIEKEITIHKEYGSINNTSSEENISFDIFNYKNELIDTITTDINGDAKITLPYGKYKVVQRNTNNGYNKVDDFEVIIDENDRDYYYTLYDYKIEVPDTGIRESNSYLLVFLLIIPIIYLKRKYVK